MTHDTETPDAPWHADNDTPTERARRRGVPLIPPRPERIRPNDSNPIVAVCGECGIELRYVMHYSCSRPRCPWFAQVTL